MINESHYANFGLDPGRVWQAIITGHVVIPVESRDPVWGESPDDDPSRGVVYTWKPVGTHTVMVEKWPTPRLVEFSPGNYGCKYVMGNRYVFARNLAAIDSRLRYPRVRPGTPVLMWMGRQPLLVKPLDDCDPNTYPLETSDGPGGGPGFVSPGDAEPRALAAPFGPWICFRHNVDPLSRYCDCSSDGALPPCPDD